MSKAENITLFYRQERSDKVYKVNLEEKEDNYIVNFAYGKRGATLKTGTKTQTPVAYEKAKKIYDKLVLSKSAKGYVPDEGNTINYVHDNEQRKTGIHCQLLNPVEEAELDKLFADDNWCLQEKMDGKRMLIQKNKTEVVAINRKGLSVGAPEKMIKAANEIKNSFIIDGEAVGENLYVFDVLSFDEVSLKNKPHNERYKVLQSIELPEGFILVNSFNTSEEKQKAFERLKQENAEGVVFKKQVSKYLPGRPNSAGDQVKFKFYDTVSVIVSKVNDKRSVGMSLLEDGIEIFVGNVTISVNKEIPNEGDVIEVRYLYAYKGGSIYQPTFLQVREDIEKEECVLSQLKYKQEA